MSLANNEKIATEGDMIFCPLTTGTATGEPCPELLSMAAVGGGMIGYFKWKNWI